MLIYIKLALGYIASFKKRSISMILAITLSVFLVVTIGSLSESARQADINNMKNTSGSYHVVNRSLIDAMNEYEVFDWDLIRVSLTLALIGAMLIYSLYGISVLERIREYGAMKAIGSTTKQIIHIILIELLILYLIGVVLGVLLGTSFIQLFKDSTLRLFTHEKTKLNVIVTSSYAIKLSIITSLISITLAGLKSIIMAKKLSPIETMRKVNYSESISIGKRENILEKNLKSTQKISYKNLRTNRKALIFTIAIMSIGCALFIGKSFDAELFNVESKYLNKLYNPTEFGLSVNVNVPMKQGYSKEQLNDLKELPQVEEVYSNQILLCRAKFPKKTMNNPYTINYIEMNNKREESFVDFYGEDSKFSFEDKDDLIMRINIMSLPYSEIERLNEKLGEKYIDFQNMMDEPLAILHMPQVDRDGNYAKMNKSSKIHYSQILNIKEGDRITVTLPDEGFNNELNNVDILSKYENYKHQYIDKELSVLTVTDKMIATSNTHMSSDIYLYVSEDIFKELTGIDAYRKVDIDMKDDIGEEDYKYLQEKVQDVAELYPKTILIDFTEMYKEASKKVKQINVLENSISIILILISGLSIFNNINYNLMSRMRQHGIMRAIGLTVKQFRHMIKSEGLMYGFTTAIFSCILGFIGQIGVYIYHIYTIKQVPISMRPFFIQPKIYLIVILLNLIIGYLATIDIAKQVRKIEIKRSISSVE